MQEVQCSTHKDSPIIHILSRIKQFLVLIPLSLILSSHLRLGLPKDLFPLGLPVKILKVVVPSSNLATWPTHLNLLDLITLTTLGERYKLRSSSLWSLLGLPFASLLFPNIRPRIMFSNTLSLHFSLNTRNHVPQPYIIGLYISIFKFLERSEDDKSVWTEQ